MLRITVDRVLSRKLHQLYQATELCDASGRLLGRFLPAEPRIAPVPSGKFGGRKWPSRASCVWALLVIGAGATASWEFPESRLWVEGALAGDSFHQGWPTRAWVAALRSVGRSAVDRAREQATLQSLRDGGLPAVPVLVEALNKNDEVAADVRTILVERGEDVVPFLLRGLEGKNRAIRGNVLRTLERMGPRAHQATSVLANLVVRETDEELRFLAVNALNAVDLSVANPD